MKLQGMYVDTATPFDHAGDLYRVKIEHNIGKWNQTSVAGYVVGGFTGEGALLSAEEKRELWKLAAASAGPEKTLIAGVEAAGVQEASRMVNIAAELGFQVALVEPADGDKRMPRVETKLLYFRSVADRAGIPILISNRSCGMCADTMQVLAAHPNIAGIVDNSGDIAGIQRLAGLLVLWGAESSLWNALQSGASGAVLAFANAAPYATIALWEAHRTREEEAGVDWQSRIAPAAELVNLRLGIPGLKHAMDLNGFYGGPPRLPLTAPSPAEKREIQSAFESLKS
jgi:4-hydroxy-2-oxoglutarate aldolase